PAARRSRICPRKSTARPACESAMVSFWQTRQRSSCAISITRDSRAGPAANGRASRPAAVATPMPSARSQPKPMGHALRTQGSDQRQDRIAQQLRRQGARMLVAYAALAIDQECFRDAVYAEIDPDPAVPIKKRIHIGIAAFAQPAHRIAMPVLVVQSV